MYGLAPCSNGRRMFRPIVLPPASCAPRLAASMMPGPPPERDDEAVVCRDRAPRLQRVSSRGELARVLVVARPLEPPCGSRPFRLVFVGRIGVAARPSAASARSARSRLCDARRSEEHHRVLDLLLPETAAAARGTRPGCGSAAPRRSRETPASDTPAAAATYSRQLLYQML